MDTNVEFINSINHFVKNFWYIFVVVSFILFKLLPGIGVDTELKYSYGILEISHNSNGEIVFGGSVPIPVPIGEYELNLSKTIASIREEVNQRLLIIEKDNVAYAFEIIKGFQYEIQPGEGIAIFRKLYEENGDIVLKLDSIDPRSISPNEKETFQQNSVKVTAPSANDIDFYPSIWNTYNIPPLNMNEPGVKTYDVKVNPEDVFEWPYYWCATDYDILSENLENMTVRFYVNNELVPDSFLYRYSKKIYNWKCQYWSAKVSGWEVNKIVNLKIRYTLLKDLFDGDKEYPSGEYIFELVVTVN